MADAGDGGYRIEYELFDTARPTERLLGQVFARAPAQQLRDVAHQIADAVYQKVTGIRGAFYTRIAYVSARGLGKGARYSLMVADSDGFKVITIVVEK